MNPDSIFLNSTNTNICVDDCAKETKDLQNVEISNYELFQYLPVNCDGKDARYPTFSYDHVNLHGGVGYGVAEGCLVDTYSYLRNDPAQLTRDRCRIQLFQRVFQGCPDLKPVVVEADEETNILQGDNQNTYNGTIFPCKRQLTELQTKKLDPLLDCTKEVQDPVHVVEPWIRGGDDTRSYVKRQEFLKGCAKYGNRANRGYNG